MAAAYPQWTDAVTAVLAGDAARLSRLINPARVRDHHAIMPTDKAPTKLAPDARRLYDLVAQRLLAAVHGPARLERQAIGVRVGDVALSAMLTSTIEPGWYQIEPPSGHRPGEPDVRLATLDVGGEVTIDKVEVRAKRVMPPRPYTEGDLVAMMASAGRLVEDEVQRKALEERGIGTPATRAAILEKLIKDRYVERHRRFLVPTLKGRQVIEALGPHPLTQVGLTAEWEQRLGAVHEGKESRAALMDDIRQFTRDVVNEMRRLDVRGLGAGRTLGPCPRCRTRDVVELPDRFVCQSWEGPEDGYCGFVVWRWRGDRRVGLGEALFRMERNEPHRSPRKGFGVPPGSVPGGAPSPLPPYGAWSPRGDLGSLDDRERLVSLVQEVVGEEGPLLVRRVLSALAAASGRPITRALRSRVNRASAEAVRRALVIAVAGDPKQPQLDLTLHAADQAAVVVRQRGPRQPDEIPRAELVSALRVVPEDVQGEARLRALAQLYDLPPTPEILGFLEKRLATPNSVIRTSDGGG
jgi:hypothetical protein